MCNEIIWNFEDLYQIFLLHEGTKNTDWNQYTMMKRLHKELMFFESVSYYWHLFAIDITTLE